MAIIPRQIGWSQESNLLWQILRQMDQLTKVTSTSGGGIPSLTATQIAFGDGSNLMTSSGKMTWDDMGGQLTLSPNTVTQHGIFAFSGDDANNTSYFDNANTHDYKLGINTTAPSVALDVVGDAKIGDIAGASGNTYLTIDNVIKEIKLNVDNGIGGATVKGIDLDGVNDSYKFGNSQTVGFEMIGDIQNVLATYFQGLISGIYFDNNSRLYQFGEIDGSFNNTILYVDDINQKLVFYSGLGIYQFNNVPTYGDNNAALAGGLVRGNIYQLGPIFLGDASLLAIVY
jgi:hypothetical protein